MSNNNHSPGTFKEIKKDVIVFEYEAILDAIRICRGHKGKAAKLLNIDRKTLYNKIKKYETEILSNNN